MDNSIQSSLKMNLFYDIDVRDYLQSAPLKQCDFKSELINSKGIEVRDYLQNTPLK